MPNDLIDDLINKGFFEGSLSDTAPFVPYADTDEVGIYDYQDNDASNLREVQREQTMNLKKMVPNVLLQASREEWKHCGGYNFLANIVVTSGLLQQLRMHGHENVAWNPLMYYYKGGFACDPVSSAVFRYQKNDYAIDHKPLTDASSWQICSEKFNSFFWSVGGEGQACVLTHRDLMKFVADYLHNGFKIGFVADETNAVALSTITIDGVEVGLCTDQGGAVPSGAFEKNKYIELIYNESFEKLVFYQNSGHAFGEFFPAQGATFPGAVRCCGQALQKANYQKLWEYFGIYHRNSSDTTTGFCWTGAEVVYIDLEYAMAAGNNYFHSVPPHREKQIASQLPYRLGLDNGEVYQVDQNDGTKYINVEDNEDVIYFNGLPININSIAYDRPQPQQYKEITGRSIDAVFIEDAKYSANDSLNDRKFTNGAIVAWTYVDNQDINEGTYLYQGATDPRNIVFSGTVSSVADNTITVLQYNYTRDAINDKKWVWDEEYPEGEEDVPPQATELYTETNAPSVGDKTFTEPVNVYAVTDYSVYNVYTDNGTAPSNTYQRTEAEPSNDFANIISGILYYTDNNKPTIGSYLYLEQIQTEKGKVSSLYNILVTDDNEQAVPTDILKEYKIGDESYYTVSNYPENNDWLYAEPYPEAIGIYTAFTSNSITIDGEEYNLDPEHNGRYLGPADQLFYTKSLHPITIADNYTVGGTVIADYLYSDEYCTTKTQQIQSITTEQVTTVGGNIYTRYKQGEIGETFRMPNLAGGVPFGITNITEYLIRTRGKIPNITGSFGGIGTGATVKGAFRKGSMISNVRTASSRSQNYNFDASWVSNLYVTGQSTIQPAGIGVTWFTPVS